MNILRIVGAFIKLNVQIALAYRSEALVQILLNLMWLGWELTSLAIIFSNTTELGGWGPAELIALLGVWRLVNTLMSIIVWPNTEKFNQGLRDGSLDYTFLQPANSQFLVSVSRIELWRLPDFIIALALILVGLAHSGRITSALNIISFLALMVSGFAVLYSLWIVMISITFWFTKFDNNVTILAALLDAGRFPAQVYPFWLRLLITFVIPIAVATTVPLQALRGDLAWWEIVGFLALGAASVLISSRLWKAGVRRYSGASA
ncbi:MAG: ABC-2 family transporter protein [Anaerolineae bacterium]|nr:ABC-2 family transporter protein [Thermoflexales bacterium]MDW8407021.1 ABC-2 family transporter protein [Anaerolineae bacterium]